MIGDHKRIRTQGRNFDVEGRKFTRWQQSKDRGNLYLTLLLSPKGLKNMGRVFCYSAEGKKQTAVGVVLPWQRGASEGRRDGQAQS